MANEKTLKKRVQKNGFRVRLHLNEKSKKWERLAGMGKTLFLGKSQKIRKIDFKF